MKLIDIMEQWRVMRAAQTCMQTSRERERQHRVYLYPLIDGLKADEVDAQYVLSMISEISDASTNFIGRRILSDVVNAYDYAAILGQVKHNPAARLAKYLPPLNKTNHAFLSAREFRAMLRKIDNDSRCKGTVYNAFYMIVYSALRRREVLLAQWDEIDIAERTWTIPGERMKMRLAHSVPISNPMMAIFEQQRGKSDKYVFPSPRTPAKHINLSAANQLLQHRGYSNRQTLHGIRHVFSTRANDSGLWSAKLIERQLDHRPRGVAGVYDKSTMLDGRRHLMEWWADQVQQWRGLA